MRETERICQQMRQMIEGEAWHGPSAVEILRGVSATLAAAVPVAGAHSIGKILAHLTAVQQMLCARIAGGDDSVEQFPEEPAPSEATWQQSIADFFAAELELRRAIAAFPDGRLDVPLKAGGSSAYNNFQGNVQHTAYHLGQIALLKKMEQDPA